MKTSLLTLLVCLLATSASFSAELVGSVSDARKKAKETKADYVVLAYGGDWDKFGKMFKERLWANPELLSQLTPSTLATEMTWPENPTKEEQEKRKELIKDFGENPRSLPAIFFFDQEGFCYASLTGAQMSKKPAELAKQLKDTQKLREKRDAMLSQASTLSGAEKAKILGLSGEIPGLNRQKNLVDELKKCDPDDKSGYQKRFTFDPWKYHKLLEGPLEDGAKELDAMVADPAYTAEQKQIILGIKSTLQRKNKADKAQIKATFEKMKALDPNSVFGKSADKAIQEYAK